MKVLLHSSEIDEERTPNQCQQKARTI